MDNQILQPGGRWKTLLPGLCIGVTGLWVVSLITTLLPSQLSNVAAQDLQEALLILFVVLHATISNGWRGAAAFITIALAVSFGMEIFNLAWGFPFVAVTHNLPGLRIQGIPVLVGVSYLAAGWPAWVMARLIVRSDPSDVTRLGMFATPIIASFILTGYDLAFDPIGSTVLQMWTFHRPSGQFGVPLSNFLVWMVTGWVFFQVFALVERRLPPSGRTPPRSYWLLPSVVWVVTALSYIPWLLTAPTGTVSVGTRTFVVADIYEAGLIAAIVVMLPPALAAAFRLYMPKAAAIRH
jgi:uncharacterized membrane protein